MIIFEKSSTLETNGTQHSPFNQYFKTGVYNRIAHNLKRFDSIRIKLQELHLERAFNLKGWTKIS